MDSKESIMSRIKIDQNTLWLLLKIAVVTGLAIAFFFNDLIVVFNDALVDEATNYILIVPFILIYLFYRKRKTLRAVIPLEKTRQTTTIRYTPIAVGTIIAVLSIMLYWYGSSTFTPVEYHMLALPIFVTSLVLIFFNIQTLRQAAFPILFLIFLVPPPSDILYTVGSALSTLSSILSNGIVNLVGISTTLITEYGNPLIVLTRPGGTQVQFSVDVACSGIYSLISFMVFAILVAYLNYGKLWKKIALVGLGIPVIYAFNVARIVILLVIGYQIGEGLALQIFHLLGGWILILIGTLLLFLVSEKILKAKIFEKQIAKCQECRLIKQTDQSLCHACGSVINPQKIRIRKSHIVKIVSVITIIGMLIYIQAPVFALTKAPNEIFQTTSSGQQGSTEIFPKISGYSLSYMGRDTGYEELAAIDLALDYVYIPLNGSANAIWLSFEMASSRSLLHRWETCLMDWQIQHGLTPKINLIEMSDIEIGENPPILSRFFAYYDTKQNYNQVVLYWFESSVFTLNSTTQQKYVKISLIENPQSTEQLPEIKKELVSVAKSMVGYWEPTKMWTSITFLISQNSTGLLAATSVMLVIMLIFSVFENSKQRRANQKIYRKISEGNQQLINAINEAEQENNAIFPRVQKIYQKTIKEPLDEVQLLKKLQDLEKMGLIGNQIVSKEDVPISTWKTQMPKDTFKKLKIVSSDNT